MWIFWLIAAGVFFIIEMATIGFLVFWLGIGAILAMITSFITDSVLIQLLVFVVTSIILLIFTRPLLNKFIKSTKDVKTNAYSIIGKKGIVVLDINNTDGSGQIKVNGEVWSAKSDTDEIILQNTKIEVVDIDGVKAVVRRINTTAKILG